MMAGTNGYRAGGQCFDSKASATDHIMSQVVPVITRDGALQHPVKQGSSWAYNGHIIQLTLPECDPLEQFEDGITVGTYVIALMFTAFLIKTVIRMLRHAEGRKDDED